MNRLLLTCLLFFTSFIVHAQQKPGIDASIENAKAICEKANQTYLDDLKVKRMLVVEKASPTMDPFIEFIDKEIAYLGGDRTHQRTILSSAAPEDKKQGSCLV